MLKYLAKLIIGLVFIASAILKLITIDNFEVYIFSSEFLSLDASILAARLIITLELFLGILLCLNFYKRIVDIALITTLVFTAFLFFKVTLGDTENCQCFGNDISLTPLQSIYKNIFLIIGLFWVRRLNTFIFKRKALIASVLGVTSLAIPNIISPPDFLYYDEYATYATYDTTAFSNFENEFLANKQNEKMVVAFLSTKCPLCKLSAKKISTIVDKYKIKESQILYVFPDSSDIDAFFVETNSTSFPYFQLPKQQLYTITQGGVPLILLYNNQVKEAFVYRGIEENKINRFFLSE